MSYQVLARKWRPHDFSSLLGQDHVVRALTHALTENRLHHAYLFTGTRGVGKTTISRILAKCLNCVGPDGKGGITAEPCGVCEACRAIDEDRFVDYIEMDAASTRGIDDMVSLLERAKYVPTSGRFKVYMIDEVHQLTSAAFNAMLKTLEEPPEYVKFILATTDPQKVPVTVLSRCLQFNLKSLSPQLIADHMSTLLGKEGISFEKPALRMLANGARGSMRDGLSLLDQAIAYSAGNLTLEAVREMLGTIDATTLIRLLGALTRHDAKGIMTVADEIGARSLSYTQALKDLTVILHKIAMAQQLPETLTDEDPDAEALATLANAFSPEEVQLFYQIAIHGRNEMHLAPDEYAGFTMTLLRMLAFAPFDGNRLPAAVAPITQKEPITSVGAAALPKSEPAKAEPPAAQSVQPAVGVSAVSTAEGVKAASAKTSVNAAAAPTVPSEETPEDLPWNLPAGAEQPVFIKNVLACPKDEKPITTASGETVKKSQPVSAKTASAGSIPSAAAAAERKAPVPPISGSSAAADDLSNVPNPYDAPFDDSWEPPEDDVPYGAEFGPEDGEALSFDDAVQVPASFPARKNSLFEQKEEIIPEEPVRMNPWLKAAEKILLDDTAQPLVTSAELKSFDGSHMELTVDLEKLTAHDMVDKLRAALAREFGEDLTLSVSVAPTRQQNLRTLRAQRLRDEKRSAFEEIRRNPWIVKSSELFGAEPNYRDLILLDEDGNPRKN